MIFLKMINHYWRPNSQTSHSSRAAIASPIEKASDSLSFASNKINSVMNKLACTKLKLMATQSTYLDYVFTKTSHMNHRPSKALVDTRTDCSPPVSHSRYQPDHTIIHVPECSLRTSAHYHTHILCVYLHIYLHAS